MVDNYKVIFGEKDKVFIEQIEEKKSKFISYIKQVETEDEAIEFINSIKKKHYDASHNCSAFIIGNNKELIRSSDDGEPQGTAGRPMLDVLMGSDIVNIAVVVTRYFGGTLLGKGGIMRAYAASVQEGLKSIDVAQMTLGKKMVIDTDYANVGNILYHLNKLEIPIDESEYTDKITLTITVSSKSAAELILQITEITSGNSKVSVLKELYFPQKI